jgi:hypothetical protein
VGYRSTGFTALTFSGGSSSLMSWSGVNSDQAGLNGGPGDGGVNNGWTSSGGTVVLDFGYSTTVDLVSVLDGAGAPSRLAVRNTSGGVKTAVIVMMW